MSKTYFYCVDNTCNSREVTMTNVNSCAFHHVTGSKQSKEEYCEYWQESVRFSLNAVAAQDITVHYTLDYRFEGDWSPSQEDTLKKTVVIPAGQTSVVVEFYCYVICHYNMGGGGYGDEEIWQENPTLIEQPKIPECCLTSPTGTTCTLDIVSYDIDNCVVRGDSEGAITVCVSGASASTFWYINGVQKASEYAGTCYTFTGLTAGNYSILIQDEAQCKVQAVYTVEDGEFRTGEFIVNAPDALSAVNNPIIVQVQTAITNPTATRGINPNDYPLDINAVTTNITNINIVDDVIDGSSITFNLTSPFIYSQVFYSKAFPNKQNFFLASVLKNAQGTQVGSNSKIEIATSLAEALQKDAVIPKIYYINNDGTTVTLKARESGSRFNLDSSNVISSTNSITVAQIYQGHNYCDGQTTDNYSISCEVMVNRNQFAHYPSTGSTSNYSRMAELILPFNPNNIHKFDISGILKSYVDTPTPSITVTGTTYLPEPMQSYYVKLSELYPLVSNTNTVKKRYKTNTVPNWVINSSLDRYVANDMSAYTTMPVKFLTASPNPKLIQRNSNEFLYFILPMNYGKDLNCKGDLYFYDGTSVTGVTFFNVSTGAKNSGGVVSINISYDKLGLENYEVTGNTNRKIKRLELAIYDSDNVQYSEKKHYKFEIDEMPRKSGILFQNALGMYDSLDFIGVVEETISRESNTYTVPINYNINGSMKASAKNQATYDTKVTKKMICNTGWIDEKHFDWLMELMKSNNIYSTSTSPSIYLKLIEWNYIKSSLDDLFSVEVIFEYTTYENSVNV